MKKWNYTEYGWVLALIVVSAAMALLSMIQLSEDARMLESLKKSEAGAMAQCLRDWGIGKNGGCDWEELRMKDGTLYAVEVVVKP